MTKLSEHIHKAIVYSIKKMGLEKFKKTSFFGNGDKE